MAHSPPALSARRLACAQDAMHAYWEFIDTADDVSPAVYRAMVRTVMLSLARLLDPEQPLWWADCRREITGPSRD